MQSQPIPNILQVHEQLVCQAKVVCVWGPSVSVPSGRVSCSCVQVARRAAIATNTKDRKIRDVNRYR